MLFFGGTSDAAGGHTLAPTPVGEACPWCAESIEDGDHGFLIPTASIDGEQVPMIDGVPVRAWHRECFLRQVVGSLGHQEGRCSCHGGTEDDPVGFSPRQAARMALANFEARRGGGKGS